jgi:hypothetical protein
MLDNRWTLTCEYGLQRTDRTLSIDLRIRSLGLRVADRLLPVRPQAFEQAPEERFMSRKACCPVGVSFGHEPLGVLLANCSFSRAATHGHCLLPASGGLIVQPAGRAIEVRWSCPPRAR